MSLTSGDRLLGAVKSEAVYGTDIFGAGPPAAYQAFRALTVNPITEQIESPRGTWTASGEKSCLLKSHTDVSWEMPLTGKTGAAGTPPAWDAFMMAAGFKKTVVALTSVSYAPKTQNDMTDTPSATIWKYLRQLEEAAAYLYKARGYRGNVTLRMTIGEEAVISGTGLALYDDHPVATIASPTAPSAYEGASCMIPTNLALTVGGTAYPVESLEISTGWNLQQVRTGEVGKGALSKVLLTRPMSGGRMAGSLRLVDGKAAFNDMVTKYLASTQAALAATLTNGTDTIAFAAPQLQFGVFAGAPEGIIKYDVPFYLNRASAGTGDDELVITCT